MKIIFKINNFENFLLFFLNFHSLKYIFPFFCPTRDGILYLYGMNPISSLFIFSKKKKVYNSTYCPHFKKYFFNNLTL